LRVQLELRGVERQLDHAAPGAREELARRRVEVQQALTKALS